MLRNYFPVCPVDGPIEPNLSGIDFCRLIRSSDLKIPIFFCSGAVTAADKEAAFSAGAQGYLAKPVDPDELTTTLRAALNIVPR